jgi:hypothetical protein
VVFRPLRSSVPNLIVRIRSRYMRVSTAHTDDIDSKMEVNSWLCFHYVSCFRIYEDQVICLYSGMSHKYIFPVVISAEMKHRCSWSLHGMVMCIKRKQDRSPSSSSLQILKRGNEVTAAMVQVVRRGLKRKKPEHGIRRCQTERNSTQSR